MNSIWLKIKKTRMPENNDKQNAYNETVDLTTSVVKGK